MIRGEEMERYMGVPGIEAEHVTLVLKGVSLPTAVQLLCYHHPETLADPSIPNLARVAFNHICSAVEDMDAEVSRLKDLGISFRVPAAVLYRDRLRGASSARGRQWPLVV